MIDTAKPIARATGRLSRSGAAEHVAIPKPLRELLKWKTREELIILALDDQTLVITSLDRHMANVVAEDREQRARERAEVRP